MKQASLLSLLLSIVFISNAQNPVLLSDINSGTSGSLNLLNNSIVYNQKVYFSATNGSANYELYSTDGTVAGTSLLKEINPGTAASNPNNFYVIDGVLYFTADDGVHGKELWKTDGTSGGTEMVLDIQPGNLSTFTTNIFKPVWTQNGFFYFVARESSTGIELWRSDGTAANTSILLDIEPGIGGTAPDSFHVFNNELYFTAITTAYGKEIWKTDGTPGGTLLMKDIITGVSTPFATFGLDIVWEHNGYFYFKAATSSGIEIWKSDGTAPGTTILLDIYPGSGSSFPDEFYEANNLLYFVATNAINGTEVWRTDGTSTGTFVLSDVCPGTCNGAPASHYIPMWVRTNKFYFAVTNPTVGYEMWETDGTTAGTILVTDVNPGSGNGVFYAIATTPNFMVFLGSSGSTTEPFITDGTAAGTYSCFNGSYNYLAGTPLTFHFEKNGAVYYGDSEYLFRADGTPAGNQLIRKFSNVGTGWENFNNEVFFCASDTGSAYQGIELWKSDGTVSGTLLVKDIAAGTSNGFSLTTGWFKKRFICNGDMYFLATNTFGNTPYLWQTDGSTSGTIPASPSSLTWITDALQWHYLTDKIVFPGIDATTSGLEYWAYESPCNLTSIYQEPISNFSIEVFPNPTTNIVHIVASEKISEVQLMTLQGQQIYNSTMANEDIEMDLNLGKFPSGIYILKIRSQNNYQIRKIVIQ